MVHNQHLKPSVKITKKFYHFNFYTKYTQKKIYILIMKLTYVEATHKN